VGFADALTAADIAVRGQLGEAALTYTPTVGSPVSVAGVFDDAYVLAAAGPGVVGVASTSPAVFLTLADLPSDPTTDLTATVTRGAKVYEIHEPKPDGLGGILLLLHQIA
jgi:hypothetical protein